MVALVDGAPVRKALELATKAVDSQLNRYPQAMTPGPSAWPTPCIAYGGDPPWLVVMAESFVASGPRPAPGATAAC